MTDPSATTSAVTDDPVERLRRLWQAGQRPDVAAFLADAGPLPPDRVAAVLRVDQQHRWRAGERVRAEDYLGRFPAVRAAPDAAVDLIYGEYLLRSQLGEQPGSEEYPRRFPEYADTLRGQIGLHGALGRTAAAAATADSAGGTTRVGRPDSYGDVAPLLRKRLLVVAGLLTMNLTATLGMIAWGGIPLDGWAGCAVATFAPGPVAGAVLWARRSLPLRWLRAVELVLFGGLYVAWSVVHAVLYPTVELPRPPVLSGFILAYAVSLPWVFLIVGYGILIPNTWRRSAAVVGVMAVTPLVINAATGLAGRATAGQPANFLVLVGVCTAAAAALAVHGSHRIDVLRRAAAEARRLGPYRLGRRLGSGGMGEVYLAEHSLLKRPCAVKLIRPEKAGDPAALSRFEREVRATAGLTHPNVVQVYDYGRTPDGTFYYAMEYVPGLSLQELVERHGPLPPARAVHLLRQLCGALEEAHAAGLVHRDIKPSNVIVGRRGARHDAAKLLDFGLVAVPDAGDGKLTRDGAVAGTPAYLSPEQAAGRGDVDARTDIYSLGGVAYFLLIGRPPFGGRSAVGMLAAHLCEPPDPPGKHRPGVPAELEAVVLRCLAKDPAERFPDVRALDAALTGCAAAGEWTDEQAADWWRAAGSG